LRLSAAACATSSLRFASCWAMGEAEEVDEGDEQEVHRVTRFLLIIGMCVPSKTPGLLHRTRLRPIGTYRSKSS
jgi:hypothetical protein